MRSLFASVLLVLHAGFAEAGDSVYTKLDLEKDCVFHAQYELGASAYCTGYKGYPVHFSEGDLRQMVQFGHVGNLRGHWESFSQFNRINDTIEWRLKDGKPYAAILRWFIENSDEDGQYTKALEGQVLVVSTVADHTSPVSCVVGYVDARANTDANVMAQKLADDIAERFRCGEDKPKFHGERGPHSGQPNGYFE